MTGQETLLQLSREHHVIEPSQSYVIDRFRPEDAYGVARCFYAVYEDAYSLDTVYSPETLIQANADGRLYSIVARSSRGDVLGHCALYPAPQCACLYEEGMLVVVPEYRNEAIAKQLVRYGLEVLAPQVPAQEVFGKAVCNHTISQKIGADCGFLETALELDYIPEAAYKKEHSAIGPVSALWMFRCYHDRSHEVFFPETYEEILGFIYSGLFSRRSFTKTAVAASLPPASRVQLRFFGLQKVARFHVELIGSDFDITIERLEQTARGQGSAIMQVYLPMNCAPAAAAIESLRHRGYFLGGVLPRWFDGDGLMMQKLYSEPHFDTIRLYSQRAEKLLDFIRRDWKKAAANL
jgi:GNAT superfamily N-acetyltransferase